MGYVGPKYKLGIFVGKKRYKPADFNAKQKAAFLKKFPDRIEWWETKKQKPAS